MNFYKSIYLCVFALLSGALLVGCGGSESGPDQNSEAAESPYKIVCTVGMITDVVRNIAGEEAEVEGIIGEGVDPHLYKPTRADVVKLNAADVIFYNGLMLEGKMGDVLVQVATSGKPVHAVTEAIIGDEQYLMEKDDGSNYTDPHVWMDVQGWLTGVDVIAKALAAYDPENAEEYLSRASRSRPWRRFRKGSACW